MFPTGHPVVPTAPRSFMTLREVDKDSPRNAYLMERFEAQRTDVARVAACAAHPGILVLCTANGFFQVVDMASGSYKLFLLFLDDGDNFVDLPPRCVSIDPAPSLVASSAHIGASEPSSRELALVFAPSYTPNICHASTLTGVVHDLISMRSRPSALSVDGDFAIAGDSSGEACAWRTGAYSLLWRQSLHRAAGVGDDSAVAVTTALQHRETAFFAMSNSCIVVCSVRTGTVLTTLLDAGQGSGIAAILPTPPFADAVVEVSTAGQLTVWAPPLKSMGPTTAPAATSLASIPDGIAGQGWQVLNVVKTDMQIESASLHNGFLALGGTDGRVALFDATQLSVKKGGSGSKKPVLPMLVSFDLDLPIKHCGVANDNHFSIATEIGDVWRWPIQEVLPPVNTKKNMIEQQQQQQLAAGGGGPPSFMRQHQAADDDDDDDDDDEDADEDDNDHRRGTHHMQRENHAGDAAAADDDADDDQDEEEPPQHSTNIPTPDLSLGQQQHHHHHHHDPARRILDGAEDTFASGHGGASAGGGRGGGVVTSGGHADSDIDLPDGDDQHKEDHDDEDSPSVTQGKKLHEAYRRQQQQQQQQKPPLAGQQHQQQPATAFDPSGLLNGGGDQKEHHEWFQREGTQPPPQQQQKNQQSSAAAAGGADAVIVMDGDDDDDDDQVHHHRGGGAGAPRRDEDLDTSDSALPRHFGAAPQPIPRDVSLSPSNTDESRPSPNQHQHQHQQLRAGGTKPGRTAASAAGNFSAAPSTINDASLPSSVMTGAVGSHSLLPGINAPMQQQHQQHFHTPAAAAGDGAGAQSGGSGGGGYTAATSSSSSSGRGGTPGTTTGSSGSSPYTEGTVTSSSSYNRTAPPPGARRGAGGSSSSSSGGGGTATAGSGSTTTGSSSSQRGSELRRGPSVTDDDEAATSHGSPDSIQQQQLASGRASGMISPSRRPPLAHQQQQQQQQQQNTADDDGNRGSSNTKRGRNATSPPPPKELQQLTQGRRMNPTAAQAMLDRAVNIAEKNQKEGDPNAPASNHELAKSQPHISKLLRAAVKGEGGVVMRSEVAEQFDLQKYADEHRTLVAALEHQHPIKAQQYKSDDVAYYAIDLRRDGDDGGAEAEEAAAGDGDAAAPQMIGGKSNNHNNSRAVGTHVRSPMRTTAFARLDENSDAVGRLSPTARRDDLMPASSHKHLVARRKDPVYERQKQLAGPQMHDHLCADLLQPPMPSTVFFSDKMSAAREPKSLVLPLPVPSTPLAF